MLKPEDTMQIAQELQEKKGCAVSKELQNVPFEEQIRILLQAEKLANHHYFSQPYQIMDQNSVDSFEDFSRNPTAVAKSVGWGDVFSFNPLYKASLDLKTGKNTQSCYDEP